MEKIKRTKGERILYIAVFIILAIYALFILYHFYFLLQLATFGSASEYNLNNIDGGRLYAWSSNFTFDNFGKALEALTDDNGNTFLGMTVNSIWFSIGSMFIALFFESAVTYVVCKYKFPGRALLYNLVIFRLMLPIVGSLPSAYRVYKAVGIMNSPLILVTATDALSGANFLIMYSFFKGISWEYAEAVLVDGGGHFTIFFKIMLPMAIPAVGALALVNGISAWNSYLDVLLYNPDWPTLASGLFGVSQTLPRLGNIPAYYAALFISISPVLVVFITFSDKVMSNFTVGGLKG